MSWRGDKIPSDTNKLYSVKIDNISFRETTDDLKRAFEKYGEIGDVYIPTDRYTHESRGFAFVRYYDQRDMDNAIDGMDGRELGGRVLKVYEASRRRSPPPDNESRRSPRRDDRRRSRSRSPRDRRSPASRDRSRSPRDRSSRRRRSRSGSR